MKEQTKVRAKKVMLFMILPLFVLSMISAAVVAYFHSVNVDISVNEARESADVDFSLACLSGETMTKDLTIRNNANVPLKAIVSYIETENNNSVTYTNNLPQTITLAPLDTTTVTAGFTCDEVTESGTVLGVINYEKTK